MRVIAVRSYTTPSGLSPFDRWFDKLDETAQARIVVALDRLARKLLHGQGCQRRRLRVSDELRPRARVYFGKDGDTLVILLGGGTKKRQQDDIAAAQALWREYKHRKREP